MIEAEHLALGYGNVVVIKGVDLQFRDGEMLALVGPNGAGKSTLLRGLAGLGPPRSGEIRVDGQPLALMAPSERARRVALVEAEAPAIDVTVKQIVAQGRLPHRPWWSWNESEEDASIVEDALTRTQLLDRADRPIETLSSGEQQRAWIAMALAQRTRTLLFDEPTSHLDLRNANRIMQLLHDLACEGAAIGVVVHDVNLAAAYADRIALLSGGKLLACGSIEEVMLAELLSAAYDSPIAVRRDEDGMLLAFAKRPPRDGSTKGEVNGQHIDAPG